MNGDQTLSRREERRAMKAREKALKRDQEAHFIQLEQKHKLLNLVDERSQLIGHLRGLHEGSLGDNYHSEGFMWMNSVAIKELNLKQHALRHIPTSRVLSLYYLSVSIDRLCRNSEAMVVGRFLQCVLQLLQELDYYFLSAVQQSMKLVMATQSSSVHPVSNDTHDDDEILFGTSRGPPLRHSGVEQASSRAPNDATTIVSASAGASSNAKAIDSQSQSFARTSLFKFDGRAVFEHLRTPHVSHELCYTSVMLGLLSSLESVYATIASHDFVWKSSQLFLRAQRIDKRLMEVVLGPAVEEVTVIASGISEEHFDAMRTGLL